MYIYSPNSPSQNLTVKGINSKTLIMIVSFNSPLIKDNLLKKKQIKDNLMVMYIIQYTRVGLVILRV